MLIAQNYLFFKHIQNGHITYLFNFKFTMTVQDQRRKCEVQNLRGIVDGGFDFVLLEIGIIGSNSEIGHV